MTDSFYLGAYWKTQDDSMDVIANRTRIILHKLGEFNEHFINWYPLGLSRRMALENKVQIETNYLKSLYLNNSKEIINSIQGNNRNYYTIGFWTGHREGEASSISFTMGGKFDNLNLYNCCVLKIPFEGDTNRALLTLTNGKYLLKILLESLDPDYAVLTSHALNDKFNTDKKPGWITYIKEDNMEKFNAEQLHTERVNNGNIYFLSQQEDICYNYNLVDYLTPVAKILNNN